MTTNIPPLRVVNVHKSYGSQSVLRGFTGSFTAGRIAALVGPNGVGKTTLLRIIAGLQRASAGTIECGSVLYYGGFDTLPVRGTVNQFRRALGLDASLAGGRRLRNLSRGELHQVGLDATFGLSSEVLLLDEPWTALEPDAREALNGRVRAAAAERIVVCSSHDLDEVARIADDVVFLAAGQALWRRREDGGPFDRDEFIRIYRESKR